MRVVAIPVWMVVVLLRKPFFSKAHDTLALLPHNAMDLLYSKAVGHSGTHSALVFTEEGMPGMVVQQQLWE
jgi:hypothetical protein